MHYIKLKQMIEKEEDWLKAAWDMEIGNFKKNILDLN